VKEDLPMKPDSIDPALVHEVVRTMRSGECVPHVDDETLANLIEHGIDAVPHDQRAPLFRAIGNSPEIASIVAELAPAAASERTHSPLRSFFGRRARTLQAAWAACAVLAVAATWWHFATLQPGLEAEVALLDGGVEGPSHDFADNLHQSLRRKTVIMLWALLAVLTAPAILATGRSMSPARSGTGSLPGAP
jgi:hypothetical protein